MAPAPAGGVHRLRCGVLLLGSPLEAGDRRAARWFLRSVWPLVRAAVPAAGVTVPVPPARWWARPPVPGGDGVVRADPAALRARTGHAVVAVAAGPASPGSARGVLACLAAGTPVVATPGVLEGLPAAARDACRCAPGVHPLASALVEALVDPLAAQGAPAPATDPAADPATPNARSREWCT